MRGPLQGPSRGPRPPRSAPAVPVQTPPGRAPETPPLIHPDPYPGGGGPAGPGGTGGWQYQGGAGKPDLWTTVRVGDELITTDVIPWKSLTDTSEFLFDEAGQVLSDFYWNLPKSAKSFPPNTTQTSRSFSEGRNATFELDTGTRKQTLSTAGSRRLIFSLDTLL